MPSLPLMPTKPIPWVHVLISARVRSIARAVSDVSRVCLRTSTTTSPTRKSPISSSGCVAKRLKRRRTRIRIRKTTNTTQVWIPISTTRWRLASIVPVVARKRWPKPTKTAIWLSPCLGPSVSVMVSPCVKTPAARSTTTPCAILISSRRT